MVDAVDLVFREQREHERIQLARRLDAVPERLLHYDASPGTRGRIPGAGPEPTGRKMSHDRLEHARRHSKVEEPASISRCSVLLDLIQLLLDAAIRPLLVGVTAAVVDL